MSATTNETPTRSLDDVLEQLRARATSKRALGDTFERLMRAYLQTDSMFAQQFGRVWLWSEWPGRDGQPDTGIDLVAEQRDGGLCAIQCKFYDPRHQLQKSDIDSFFTASGKHPFTSRLIVSTTDLWSVNAERALEQQQIPVSRLRVQDLQASPVDWGSFVVDEPDRVELRPRKRLHPHQVTAVTEVLAGLGAADRGKLVMACGTGKTLTSLRIAEALTLDAAADAPMRVLLLVPSISLLSQTLREWTAECELPMRSFAVCSDAKVSRVSEDISAHDLAFPATTSAERLLSQFEQATATEAAAGGAGMLVVFSTYQSIDVVHEAQQAGLPEFDLVICDEAHRTTGVTLAGESDSHFVRVHDQAFIRARKRLYMTATPRLFDDATKAKAGEANAVLVSMDDPDVYGEELHRLGFGESVERGLLTDYKVMVLAVDESYVDGRLQRLLADADHELTLDDMVKLVGCWKGLARQGAAPGAETDAGGGPMRRAVAFAQSIQASKRVADMLTTVGDLLADPADPRPLVCEAEHVDGTQNALQRNHHLDWLRADPPNDANVCRVLSNARCLSEGVDVPALDAVMFLNPRNSVVDVVQSVGRVMRKVPGKDYGYIILPIGIPADMAPEEALADNKKYKVVWQVLQALRAHDDRFNATINKLDLTRSAPESLQIIGIGAGDGDDPDAPDGGADDRQLGLPFRDIEEWRDAIYARIVQKCGDRLYWESWAKDIAEIAARHTTRLEAALEDPVASEAFARFLVELRADLNPAIAHDEAVEMLSQHLITKPVFDALFAGYSFTESNPVSRAMQAMLDQLDETGLGAETDKLERFYASVHQRVEGVDTDEGRQKVITELYERFFRGAFPKMAERLGIVYTPVEIVDFILRSVQHVLTEQFGTTLGTPGVHVLDPFTGTGTFIVRLLQSGLISQDDLRRKFAEELHANELVLLAYYIGAINIEAAYHQRHGDGYEPFPGIVLTDTFQLAEGSGELEVELFPDNHERVTRQRRAPVTVVVGNPPYSVGQESENDANQNLKYPAIDSRIEATYAARSEAKLKRNLYDSYVRAIRWASDRIGDSGVVAFVTNGYFIDGLSQDGLRKSLVDEFTDVYCLNLRGNATGTQGEVRRREGGGVFGGGSRAPVAITLLVRNPERRGAAAVHYHDIGDGLSRETKLGLLTQLGSAAQVPWRTVVPDEHGDWINQRDPHYERYRPLGSTVGAPDAVFVRSSPGVSTSRDAWVYNYDREVLEQSLRSTMAVFNRDRGRLLERLAELPDARAADLIDEVIDTDPRRISWSDGLKRRLARDGDPLAFDPARVVSAVYRPFTKQLLYLSPDLVERPSDHLRIFPAAEHGNLAIVTTGGGARREFSALMVDAVPNLHLQDSGQSFPRYRFEPLEDDAADQGSLLAGHDAAEAIGGYRRIDNVTDAALAAFRAQYDDPAIDKDDVFFYVYGVLHSRDYRERFGAELRKMLPRLPMVEGFRAFSDAGRALAELHVGYETVEPFPLEEVVTGSAAREERYRVRRMRFGARNDRSCVVYNEHLTLAGIPESAHDYVVNGKSALGWVMDRYRSGVDPASGIVNDPNAYSDDPRYVVDLVKRIVTVSIRTLELVERLPELQILSAGARPGAGA